MSGNAGQGKRNEKYLTSQQFQKEKIIMYTYKTEILTVSTKWFSDKANAEDILMLDKLINERASDEGWELATYDYMATSSQIRGAFVVTFRKEKA